MQWQFLESIDQGTVPWFEAHRTDRLNDFTRGVTHLGDSPVLLGVVFLAVCLLLDLRRYPTAVLVVATVLVAFGLNAATKQMIKRQRPTVRQDLVTISSSYSFPSGHALDSAAVYLTLALVATARVRPPGKSLAVIAAGVVVFLIGVSRLYLGVHFVTDVLAGWAGGLALALTCYLLDEKLASGADLSTAAKSGRLLSQPQHSPTQTQERIAPPPHAIREAPRGSEDPRS